MTEPLKQLQEQHKIIGDRVRSVVHGESTGFYLHGRAGTAKTYTIRKMLDEAKMLYTVANGHLTEIALFQTLRDHHDGVTVLDDLSTLLKKPLALQLLLAALGNPHDGGRKRNVSFRTARGDQTFPFTGGIIAISNLPLRGHNDHILAALRDRMHCLSYEPTNEQIHAQILKIAENGLPGVEPKDAVMVAEFMIAECKARSLPASIRQFVDKAVSDFRLCKAGKAETDWHDLVTSTLVQESTELKFPTRDISRAEAIEAERRVVLDLQTLPTRKERLAEWTRRTGKGRPAYDRRLKELKDEGKLDMPSARAA